MSDLLDLEALIEACRDDRTRVYLTEAVACYSGGAYRACIVATWITIVFDIIHKLQELDLTGDLNARAKLTELHSLRLSNDFRGAWQFEISLFEVALKEFEFITPIEREDFRRLLDDRNLCAHPSMRTDEDPYQPTPELCRYHMRNAVDHVLRHPPVQGKAALDSIWNQIHSAYFPADIEKAHEVLQEGPLGRARPALVRSVTIGLTKSLLRDSRSSLERRRQIAALVATSRMYEAECLRAMVEIVSSSTSSLSDDLWHQVVVFFKWFPTTWESAGSAVQTKAQLFVKNCEASKLPLFLSDALGVPSLRASALSRVSELRSDELGNVELDEPSSEYLDQLIDRYLDSKGFREAENNAATLISPNLAHLSKGQLIRLLQGFCDNTQIAHAWGTTSFMTTVFDRALPWSDDMADDWVRVYQKALRISDTKRLRDKIAARYPERVPEIVKAEDDVE